MIKAPLRTSTKATSAIFLTALAVLSLSPSITRANPGDSPSLAHDSTRDEQRRSVVKPNDYGRYRGEFRLLCDLIREDGRTDLIARLLEPHLEKTKECPDCRPLFMQFYTPCQPPPQRKERTRRKSKAELEREAELETSGEEPTPTPSPTPTPRPARLPQLGVLDVASDLSRQIASDSRNPTQTHQALFRLKQILRGGTDLSTGEREYLETLIAYIGGGFVSDLVSDGALATSGAVSQRKPSVEGLFERPSLFATPTTAPLTMDDFADEAYEERGPPGFR